MASLSASQVGLLLLSKVVESNPEPFRPHYCQLLELFGTVLKDLSNPSALYYCILSLTAMTAHTGTEEMVRPHAVLSCGSRLRSHVMPSLIAVSGPDAVAYPQADRGHWTPDPG